MKREDISNDNIVSTYRKKACNISATCIALGIDRKTFYKWKESDPDLLRRLNEADESMLDDVESMLYSKIIDGDLTAIIFFLKTKGKKRGYVEKQEVTAEVSGWTINVKNEKQKDILINAQKVLDE